MKDLSDFEKNGVPYVNVKPREGDYNAVRSSYEILREVSNLNTRECVLHICVEDIAFFYCDVTKPEKVQTLSLCLWLSSLVQFRAHWDQFKAVLM